MKFTKFMLMNKAGETLPGGTSSETPPNQSTDEGNVDWKAKFEAVNAQLAKLSTDFEAVKGNSAKLLTEKNAVEKKLKELSDKELELNGDTKTLLANERQRVKDLEAAMEQTRAEIAADREKVLQEAKEEHAIKLLGGRDRIHNVSDLKDGLMDKLVIDPSTGKWQEAGDKIFVDDFMSRFAYRIKSSEAERNSSSAGKAIIDSKAPLTAEQLEALPFQERLAYAAAQAEGKA